MSDSPIEDGVEAMPLQSARAIWEVTAGLIPGRAEEQHTRRWGITSEEWEGAENKQLLLMDRWASVMAYSLDLQIRCASGYDVNWVRVEFVWP